MENYSRKTKKVRRNLPVGSEPPAQQKASDSSLSSRNAAEADTSAAAAAPARSHSRRPALFPPLFPNSGDTMAFNRNKRSGSSRRSSGSGPGCVQRPHFHAGGEEPASQRFSKSGEKNNFCCLTVKRWSGGGGAAIGGRAGCAELPLNSIQPTKMQLYQALCLSKLLLMQSLYLLSSTGTGAHVSLFSRQKIAINKKKKKCRVSI